LPGHDGAEPRLAEAQVSCIFIAVFSEPARGNCWLTTHSKTGRLQAYRCEGCRWATQISSRPGIVEIERDGMIHHQTYRTAAFLLQVLLAGAQHPF